VTPNKEFTTPCFHEIRFYGCGGQAAVPVLRSALAGISIWNPWRSSQRRKVMEWLTSNWLVLLLVLCCVGMMFMYGGHRKSGGDDDKHRH